MFDSNPDSSSLASSSFSQVLGWNELHGFVALIDYATAAQRLAPFIVEALGKRMCSVGRCTYESDRRRPNL